MNYGDIKIGFTLGENFALTGTDYVGYYYIDNSIPYAGTRLTESSIKLDSKPVISTELLKSPYFRDRLLNESVSLPYDLDNVLIAPNESFNSRVFNDRLYKLYTNNLYLYSRCFMVSNDLPHGYNRAAGVYENSLQWLPQTPTDITNFQSFSAISYSEFNTGVSFYAVKIQDNQGYSFIGISPTHILSLSSDISLATLNVTSANQYVDNNSDLSFSHLSAFSITGNFMFVCDSQQNNVYKYDVGGFFNNDVTITNRRFLLNAIGGEGSALSKTKFNGPDVVFANEQINRVFVHDKNNNCIKVYDLNLSYIATVSFTAGIKTWARAFQYNKVNKYIYMIVEDVDLKRTRLLLCDNDLNIQHEYILEDEYLTDEYIRGIEFSANDSNIMYVYTNYNVFKKFVNKPALSIGKWLFYKSGFVTKHIWNTERSKWNTARWKWNDGASSVKKGLQMQNMTVLQTSSNYDEIFLFASNPSTNSFDRILHYNEPILYTSTLGSNDTDLFTLNELNVDHVNELIQAVVVNKELSKIISTMLFLKNQLIGRFAAEYDYISNLVNKGIMPLNDDEFDTLEINNIKNFYIHNNESATNAGAINRVLRSMFNVQQQLLNLTKTKITNFVPSVSGSQTVLLD